MLFSCLTYVPEWSLIHRSGSLDADPARRTAACQYNSCPANTNAATGTNSSDTRLNWVNSFPVTSMRYGINSIGPSHWGGAAPELAVAGPNVGSNVYRKHNPPTLIGTRPYCSGNNSPGMHHFRPRSKTTNIYQSRYSSPAPSAPHATRLVRQDYPPSPSRVSRTAPSPGTRSRCPPGA